MRKRSEDDIKIINTNESNEIRSNYSNKRRRLDERKEYLIKDWSKWISVRI